MRTFWTVLSIVAAGLIGVIAHRELKADPCAAFAASAESAITKWEETHAMIVTANRAELKALVPRLQAIRDELVPGPGCPNRDAVAAGIGRSIKTATLLISDANLYEIEIERFAAEDAIADVRAKVAAH